MRFRFELEGKLYTPLVWATGVMLLASGGALLLVMLGTVLGPFRFAELDRETASRALGLWIPPQLTYPLPGDTARRAEAWRALAETGEAVIESQRLGDIIAAGVGVIAIPDSRRIDEPQVDALLQWVGQGGALLVTGSVGVRTREGTWRGYGLMQRLLETNGITPLENTAAASISADARGPISASLAPSRSVLVMYEMGVPAIASRAAELRWTRALDEAAAESGASRRLRIGRGRLAWIAPGPELAFEGAETERLALRRVYRNALAWVRREPSVELLSWPAGAPFAVSLTTRRSAEHDALPPVEKAAREAALLQPLDDAMRRGQHLEIEVPTPPATEAAGTSTWLRTVSAVSERGGWRASKDEIEAWSRQRDDVRIGIRHMGPQRLLVNVTNRGDEPVDQLALRVWVNQALVDVRIERTAVGQKAPGVSFEREAESADVTLPRLAPGETQAFYLDYAVAVSSRET